MNKAWLVFKYEYTRHVLRKRFLIALLSMPIFIGVMLAASIASALMSSNRLPIGYVNQSDYLKGFVPASPKQGFLSTDVKFVPFQTEAEAENALKSNTIQAFYVIGSDYISTGNAELVYLKLPAKNLQDKFIEQVRNFLIKSQPQNVITRLTEGNHLTLQSMDGTRKIGEFDWINIVVINIAGIFFLIVLLSSSGYLMSALVEEKENRTMEIVVTSVSADQLMAGKVLGNLCVGLTQLAAWLSTLGIAYLIGRNQLPVLQYVNIPISTVLSILAIILPGFVLVGALMALLGSTVTESREAQQMAGLINLPIVCPYWVITPIIMNPHGSLALGLSFFPLTAPLTMLFRLSITNIPVWQTLTSSGILCLSAMVAIWLSARAFRLGMVRYGKKVTFKELFGNQEVRHA